MPDPIRFNLATLGQLQQPANPGIGWVGPERPAESWSDIAADPLSALFDVGRGAVTGDAPAGMNLQGLGALIAAALPVAQGAKGLRAATKAAKLADLAEAAEAAGIKAYHGSPHDFDQFSLSKIGTGEGAQAYGHGLYFAENPRVASDYQRKLSQFGHASEMPEDMATSILLDGKVVNGSTPSNKLTPLERAALTKHYSGGQAQAVRDLEESLKYMTPGTEAYEGEKATLDVLKSTDLTGRVQPFKGRMYEVQIHASPDHFLDWDKPLSEQSEHVRQALGPDLQREEFVSAAGKRLTDYSGDTLLGIKLQTELRKNGGDVEQALNTLAGMGNERWKQTVEKARALDWSGLRTEAVERPGTGSNLISDLQQQHTPAGVNEYLKAKGIPGIRYLDAGSRSAGEGSRNYVIFDENLVSILKKYGVALPVIEGLREKAKQGGGVVPSSDVHSLVQ